MSLHILSIIGARPQFVKAAMVVEAVRKYNRSTRRSVQIRHTLIHTGQHYDPKLSDVFFRELPLPAPDRNLEVGSGSHGKQTGELLARIEEVLISASPDAVMVYGDTNSTVAGALAAAKLHIPVAHVEAGLRSFNHAMPEEINRVVTDHISNVLFCPTATAVKHLEREGVTRGVHQCGDVMLDAVLRFRQVAKRRSHILKHLALNPSEYLLFTMHRAENTDCVAQLSQKIELLTRSRWPVVFPIHPRTRDRLRTWPALQQAANKLSAATQVRVIDPVSYLDMLVLESNARIVLTDSGGVQKEAYFFGVPCLTLRGETEWTETLQGGWNRLLDCDIKRTLPVVESLWSNNGLKPSGKPHLEAFGNGNAAKAIVKQLVQELSKERN